MQKFYKFLDKDGVDGNGRRWSLPVENEDGTWTPGEWMPPFEHMLGVFYDEDNGYYIYPAEELIGKYGDMLFEVEVGADEIGDDLIDYPYYLCRTCRLIREVKTWNEATTRYFVAYVLQKAMDRLNIDDIIDNFDNDKTVNCMAKHRIYRLKEEKLKRMKDLYSTALAALEETDAVYALIWAVRNATHAVYEWEEARYWYGERMLIEDARKEARTIVDNFERELNDKLLELLENGIEEEVVDET